MSPRLHCFYLLLGIWSTNSGESAIDLICIALALAEHFHICRHVWVRPEPCLLSGEVVAAWLWPMWMALQRPMLFVF